MKKHSKYSNSTNTWKQCFCVVQRGFQFVVVFILLATFGCEKSEEQSISNNDTPVGTGSYLREIPEFPADPGDFVDEITNPYLAFEVGKTFRYEGETEEGIETIIVEVTNRKKTIIGVSTTVVRDRAFLDGELIEDTEDYFAQDKDGNVWYFGEDSKEIEDGQVVSTEGSWIAGVNDAKPGIIMLAEPEAGQAYQQEVAVGIAEDMAEVISLSELVSVQFGSFYNCLETRESTPLEPDVEEFKFYKQGVGLLLEENRETGEQIELISIE